MTLDGPIRVEDRTKPTTTKVLGVDVTTYPAKTGEFYITDPATYAAKKAELQGYVLADLPLQHVYAGDDPANPKWTVVLRMSDQTAVATVKTALGVGATKLDPITKLGL